MVPCLTYFLSLTELLLSSLSSQLFPLRCWKGKRGGTRGLFLSAILLITILNLAYYRLLFHASYFLDRLILSRPFLPSLCSLYFVVDGRRYTFSFLLASPILLIAVFDLFYDSLLFPSFPFTGYVAYSPFLPSCCFLYFRSVKVDVYR